MIVFGFLLFASGIASYIYGDQMNNSLEKQFASFLSNGTTNPGSIFVTLGIALAILGIIFIIAGAVRSSNGKQK